MLKCLKPKNNQSLNRILLVLIKKKESILINISVEFLVELEITLLIPVSHNFIRCKKCYIKRSGLVESYRFCYEGFTFQNFGVRKVHIFLQPCSDRKKFANFNTQNEHSFQKRQILIVLDCY